MNLARAFTRIFASMKYLPCLHCEVSRPAWLYHLSARFYLIVSSIIFTEIRRRSLLKGFDEMDLKMF